MTSSRGTSRCLLPRRLLASLVMAAGDWCGVRRHPVVAPMNLRTVREKTGLSRACRYAILIGRRSGAFWEGTRSRAPSATTAISRLDNIDRRTEEGDVGCAGCESGLLDRESLFLLSRLRRPGRPGQLEKLEEKIVLVPIKYPMRRSAHDPQGSMRRQSSHQPPSRWGRDVGELLGLTAVNATECVAVEQAIAPVDISLEADGRGAGGSRHEQMLCGLPVIEFGCESSSSEADAS